MCMLSVFPPGVQPDPEALIEGSRVNRDGNGFAIAAGDRLIVEKSMNAGPLAERFASLRAEHPDGPALFHSRMGTGGMRTTFNCHPFYVGDDKKTVVGHNGVLWSPDRDSRKCDTREFAEQFMPAYFWNLDKDKTKAIVEKWAGRYNKIAVITVNPFYSKQLYLFNEASGHWDGGAWYSNRDYLTWEKYRAHREQEWAATEARWGEATQYGRWVTTEPGVLRYERREWEPLPKPENGVTCILCEVAGAVDPDTGYCTSCGICVDCGEWLELCQCYVPGAANRN